MKNGRRKAETAPLLAGAGRKAAVMKGNLGGIVWFDVLRSHLAVIGLTSRYLGF